jgi:hypothetical protein
MNSYSSLSDSGASVAAADSMRDQMHYSLTNVKQFVKTRSVPFWIVIGIALVTLMVVLIRGWWTERNLWSRYIDCGGCYIRFRNVISDSTDKRPAKYQNLPKPQNGYTYSMWLYVADWYNSSGYSKWKSVYYRGPPVDRRNKKTCDVTWDSIPEQQPGIWMSDTQNNLRVVITTNVSFPAECVGGGTTTDTTTETKTPPSQCSTASKKTKIMNILEYADINDFPIGQWFQLVVVVTHQRLELYLNGKLVTTTVFVGQFRSTCDTEDGHFGSTGTTFKGRLMNFRYMPLILPYQMIRMLYETESRNPLLARRDPMKELDNSF